MYVCHVISASGTYSFHGYCGEQNMYYVFDYIV